ncbi:hypothetical protein P7L79_05210 (plasmid) [Tistrella mobilis]|uniref:hypothetical protein n=1 Tax=Tistrella mobilis TaxID=171437 RepID=UPI003556074C
MSLRTASILSLGLLSAKADRRPTSALQHAAPDPQIADPDDDDPPVSGQFLFS